MCKIAIFGPKINSEPPSTIRCNYNYEYFSLIDEIKTIKIMILPMTTGHIKSISCVYGKFNSNDLANKVEILLLGSTNKFFKRYLKNSPGIRNFY